MGGLEERREGKLKSGSIVRVQFIFNNKENIRMPYGSQLSCNPNKQGKLKLKRVILHDWITLLLEKNTNRVSRKTITRVGQQCLRSSHKKYLSIFLAAPRTVG